MDNGSWKNGHNRCHIQEGEMAGSLAPSVLQSCYAPYLQLFHGETLGGHFSPLFAAESVSVLNRAALLNVNLAEEHM